MVLKKIALTGASGMVGRHVISILIKMGISCIATSRHRPEILPKDSLWCYWDLREWKNVDQLSELFRDCEALIHLGATVPNICGDVSRQSIFDTNVRASLCLGEWALMAKIPMVYLSSSTIYANPERLGIKETDPKMSPNKGLGGFYGFSKLLAEEVLQEMVNDGLKLSILRPSSIYGYGLPEGKMITDFLTKASRGEIIELHPPVKDKVDVIHALDVAEAVLETLSRETWGVFNIASESPQTIFEIAKTCVQVVGNGDIKITETKIDQDGKVRFGLNCEAALMAFDFSPKLNLIQGIKKMWDDMNGHYK